MAAFSFGYARLYPGVYFRICFNVAANPFEEDF